MTDEALKMFKSLNQTMKMQSDVINGLIKVSNHAANVNDALIADVARLEKKIAELDQVHRLIANTLIDQIKLNNELLRSNAAKGEVIPHLRIVK